MRVAAVLCALVLGCFGACSGDDGDRIRLYHAEPKAPDLEDDAIAALDHLGPTIHPSGVNFGVSSRSATRVDLLLFEDPEAETPTRQYEMVRFGDVWNLFIEGIGPGM